MKKLFFLIICIISCSFILVACSSDDILEIFNNTAEEDVYEETTISIDKKGRITEQIVEPFAKDYYNVSELESEFTSAINDINAENDEGKRAILKSIKQENGKVYVNLNFANARAYEKLQNQRLFVGTVRDASEMGYGMEVTLKNVKDGNVIGKVELMGMLDKHIIILDEPVRVKCYRQVEYVSANIDIINENEIRVLSEAGGLAYIVLDK